MRRFHQSDEFAEDTGDVAPVDLVNDEHIGRRLAGLRGLVRFPAQFLEDAVLHLIGNFAFIRRRPDAFHEVLVAEALMEGHETDMAVSDQLVEALPLLFPSSAYIPHTRSGKYFQCFFHCGVGLARTGRAVEYLVQGDGSS